MKVRITKVSAQASKNGNFIHTLKTEGKTVNVLGVNKTSGQLTYFLALPQAVKVGTEHEINMDEFRVEERPFTTPDNETLMLKWLHIR
jgi:hypothetical protein